MESKMERDLSLVMKCMKIKFDGIEMTGSEAFQKLVVHHDLLGKDYIIDWSKGEIVTDFQL
jgi:hypothetical protein